MQKKMEACPICGAHALETRSDHSYSFKYGRKDHTVKDLSHTVCKECGVSFFSPEQIVGNNARVKAYQDAIPDFISPAQVLALREKYNLTQAQARQIFGGGPTAFSKYERGEITPSAGAASNMLIALRNPDFLYALAAERGVHLKGSGKSEKKQTPLIGDCLPSDIRPCVERYAAALSLSIHDAGIDLIRKALPLVGFDTQSNLYKDLIDVFVSEYPRVTCVVSGISHEEDIIHSSKATVENVVRKIQKEYS